MDSKRRIPPVLLLVALLVGPALRPAHACKPCLGDPIERSIGQASAVLLGKVAAVAEYPATPGEKRGAGEAAIEVRVERWLKKPAKGAVKQGVKFPVRIRWDGICLGRPALPRAGDRAIFFIAESTPEGEGLLTGVCSAPILRIENGKVTVPTEASEKWGSKPLSLRKFEARVRAKK